jgi:PAS domain S-box-containing protein
VRDREGPIAAELELGDVRRVVDALLDPAAVLDRARRLVYFNVAYAELLELKRDEVLVSRPFAEEILEVLPEDGGPAVVDRCLELAAAVCILARGRVKANGRPLTLTVCAAPLEDGTHPLVLEVYRESGTSARDKTDYRRMVVEEQARYAQAIFSSAPTALLVVDEGGRVLSANRYAARLFAIVDDRQLLGRSCADLMPARILGDITQVIENGGVLEDIEIALLGKPQRTVRVSLSRLPDIRERERRALIAADDITKHTEAEERMMLANRELSLARDAALEANRTKSIFLANMSHELRTPLNAILGYSEMLIEDQKSGPSTNLEMISDLEKIHSAGEHLLSLINSVLDLSKIETGRMKLSPETFELGEVLESAAQTVGALVATNKNELVTSYPEYLGEITTDKVRLRQVVLNLLSNAAKFTEEGKITLSAKSDPIDGFDWYEISISDTGIGIAPEHMTKLFRPFFQVDASSTRRHGGTGLGLAISKRCCEMMGGTIFVESELGKGSTFRIRIPAQCPAGTMDVATIASNELIRSAIADAAPLPSRTVLCIDDDPAALEIIERHLRKEGLTVLTALGAQDGLDLARRARPALITLDAMMPGMDGWTALQQLKNDPELCQIPVVMVTIVSEKHLGFALGAADYITKPFDREVLTGTVKRFAVTEGAPILVVEDDPATLEVLVRSIAREGGNTLTASDGREAIRQLQRVRPSLVLLDLMMPGMDGFEIVSVMRAHEVWQKIPVIIMTARDLTEEDQRRLAGGVERIFQKNARPVAEVVRDVMQYAAVERGTIPPEVTAPTPSP